MDKELLDLLNNARAAGANEQQLQGIVDSYNQKKKPIQSGIENTEDKSQIGTEETSPLLFQSPYGGTNLGFQIKDPSIITIQDEAGQPLSLNTRSFPASPYTNEGYANEIQNKIKSGTLSEQEKRVVAKNKRGAFFDTYDDETLAGLNLKYNRSHRKETSIDDKLYDIDALEKSVIGEKIYDRTNPVYNEELSQLKYLKDKLVEEKVINETLPIYEKTSTVTDEGGSLFNKAVNRLAAVSPQLAGAGLVGLSLEKQQQISNLPAEFSLGLAKLKYIEPVEYKRVSNMLANGEPLSESQIASITAQGLDIKEKQDELAFINKELTPEEFQKRIDKTREKRYNNIVGNKETLRALLADGIANIADEANIEKESKESGINFLQNKIFGHRWNYSDDEIERYGKSYAQANGISPDDPRVKDAIKYLQDNEGAMIMQNSIAKNGWIRDLGKGLATPIRGIAATVEGIGKSDAEKYAEAQSQGNVNVSEKRLKRIDDSWEGTVSDVMEGTGQFITQAGLAYVTGGAIGGLGRAALGGRIGVAALEGAEAGGLEFTAADLGAKNAIGKALMSSKNQLATFITAYGQSYDSNLKQAYNYTDDNNTARVTAGIMSGLEGATELFLSPLEIAEGIATKLIKPKSLTPKLVKILKDKNITNKGAAITTAIKSGLLETAKVVGAEIGEEEVTQIADYTANAILNPQSQSFKDRNLLDEMANTAYQTGLSMALPAITSGAGAYKVNNFSKGSLMIAAQNRQHLLDQMNLSLSRGDMTQDEFNEKSAIINTAAKANEVLPIKDNGKPLTSQEKANYVYSRVAEATLKKQIEQLKESPTSADEAVIKQKEAKIKEQQEYRSNILSLKPMYIVNGNMVDKKEFDKVLNSSERENYDLEVQNDEATQEQLRKIGGKDLNTRDATEVVPKKQPTEKKSVEEELLGELVLPEETVELTEKEQPKEEKVSVSKPLAEIKGVDVSYNGEIGTIEQSETGEWVLNRGEGESDIILPVKDKNNPELSGELGIEILPEITNEQIKEAEKDKEQTGYVTSKNGNQFFISLANPKIENTVGDQVFIKGKNGKLKEVVGMEDSVKLSLINKFLEEKGLPKRTELVSISQPKASKKGVVISDIDTSKKKPKEKVEVVAEEKQVSPVAETPTQESNVPVSENLPAVESFETAKGSKYTVGEDGRTSRYKTATKEQNEPQDLTVFAKFKDVRQEQNFLEAVQRSEETGKKLYVIDKEGNIYNTNEEVKGKDVRLAIIDTKQNKVIDFVETSLTPKEGFNVFDQRRYEEGGKEMREKHLGNKVTKINYKEQNKSIGSNVPVSEKGAALNQSDAVYQKVKNHSEGIKTKFREVFKAKGNTDEQIDAAIALMDARSKSWASESEGRKPEEWYQQIADVKNGEFESNDVLYQFMPKPIKKVAKWATVFSALWNLNAKIPNKLIQYKKDYNTIKIIEDISKDGFVYIDENTGKRTQDFEGKLNDKNTSVSYVYKLWEKAGYPKISIIHESGKSKYNPLTNEIKIYDKSSNSSTPDVNEKGEVMGRAIEADVLFAEMSHALQAAKGELSVGRAVKDFVSSGFDYNKEYEKEGTYENEAHSKIEKELIDGFNKSVKYQEGLGVNKGAIETLKDGRLVIHALESPDLSTMVHEIGHIFESDLTKSEKKIVEDFGGSESFARGFERYLRDGKSPTPELNTLFSKFKEWLSNIYKSLKGSPIEKRITPEIKAIFDRMLTEQKEQNKPIQSEKKGLPEIEVSKADAGLFNEISKALAVEGNKNKQMALEKLYSGKNAKYSKEEVDAALKINSTFDDIVKDMEDDGLLTKECK